MKDIAQLEKILNITYKNKHLIASAFVHRSYLNESKEFNQSNERLEYLGDAIIDHITSLHLYLKYPEFQEGMLTSIRAAMVNTTMLAIIAKEIGLDAYLKISTGEKGKENQSILADLTEAFIGAIYLDQGEDVTRSILEKYLFPKAQEIIATSSYKDSKSILQQEAQSRFKKLPKYTLTSSKGPDHNKIFTMMVEIANKKYASGSGKSKQSAQEEAARLTLEMLSNT